MSGFLSILLNAMNNRQREREQAANQPLQDEQLRRLRLQNALDEQSMSDREAIRSAGAGLGSVQQPQGQYDTLASMLGQEQNMTPIFQGQGTNDPLARLMAQMSKAVELGRPEYAGQYKQVIDLQDTLDEMAARNKAWGGSEQYRQLKGQLDAASQVGKVLQDYHKAGGMGMVRQIVSQNPQLQKIVGDPEKLTFNQQGVMHPALHAQTKEPIPNWFYMVDQDGKTKMVELKPNQEDLIDKRFENQMKLASMQQDRQDARQGRQLAAVTSRMGGGGKAPSGYRWTADGNLEPIPGGPGTIKNKPMPAATEKRLTSSAELADSMDRFSTGFQDKYGGHTVIGELSNTKGKLLGDDTGQAQWWQDYQGYVNDVRQEKFGASLTNNEKNEFLKYIVTPRMAPSQIKQNLARQKSITDSALARVSRGYARQYDPDTIREFIGRDIPTAEATRAPNVQYGQTRKTPRNKPTGKPKTASDYLSKFGGR